MKVLLVCHGAGWAGTERHVRDLMLGLDRDRWTVQLATSEDGPLVAAARQAGLSTRLVPRRDAGSYVSGLARLIRRERPDLLHAHSGRLACLAARLARVPAVIETRHGLRERVAPLYRRFPGSRRLEGWKSRLPDLTLTVCRADAEWLVRHGRLPADRIRTIPNGIAPESPDPSIESRRAALRAAWRIPEEARILGFAGRFCPQKAPERVLEVLAKLIAGEAHGADLQPGTGRRKWQAVFCGEGVSRSRLEARAGMLGLSNHLVWTVASEGAASVLPAFDLLLLPSIWEGLPYILLEALSAGLPVLATPVGGVPEVLVGPLAEGCLSWNPEPWAERVRKLVDAAGRADWAQAARRRARDFSLEAAIASIEGAYREALGLR